jgi:two-component system nitrogen regulation response regulator GlnG
MQALASFPFPGNVRQLENVCHWLTVMAPGQRIETADLPPEIRASAAHPDAIDRGWIEALDRELARALAAGEGAVGDRLQDEFERALIRRSLAFTGGHRMDAAARLGWGRNTLTRKIQELGLEAELRKNAAKR